MRSASLAFMACVAEPALGPITRVAVYRCSDATCTALGANLHGLPPHSGGFMIGAWFQGTQDVHWSLRWTDDSVYADFPNLRDSSIISARLDGVPLTAGPVLLTVSLLAGGRDSLTWDYR